ncbi:MAG: hypothetical protein WC807_21540 [Hyphomicrobium sp.]|jgi:hypothetical protein
MRAQRARLTILAAVIPAALSSAPSSAAEVCITCTTPDAIYKCSLKDEKKIAKLVDGSEVTQRVCEKVLAKLGSHKKCTLAPGAIESCTGTARVLSMGDFMSAFLGN